jgi:hypothetical protein
LLFERRFVQQKLKSMRLQVITMEEHCGPSLDWLQWSRNRAGQFDVYLGLYDKRIGAVGNTQTSTSIVKVEEGQSRGTVMRSVTYELKRPFADQGRLLEPGEEARYQASVEDQEEDFRNAYTDAIWYEAFFRKGTPIRSVDELERKLEADLRINRVALLCHRLKIWRRSLFDNSLAAWRLAVEDESNLEETTRLGFRRRLRPPAISIAVVWSMAAVLSLPFYRAVIASAGVALLLGLAAIAYAPSFIWFGTKTIIARSAFAARVVQRPIDEPFEVLPRWRFLEDWTGVGAVSIAFRDGLKVFVPLVNSPSTILNTVREKQVRYKEHQTLLRQMGL